MHRCGSALHPLERTPFLECAPFSAQRSAPGACSPKRCKTDRALCSGARVRTAQSSAHLERAINPNSSMPRIEGGQKCLRGVPNPKSYKR
jgi:hypothetical protein